MMRFKIAVIQGHIFSIIMQSIKGPDAHLKLAVNFDEDVISLYKEVWYNYYYWHLVITFVGS